MSVLCVWTPFEQYFCLTNQMSIMHQIKLKSSKPTEKEWDVEIPNPVHLRAHLRCQGWILCIAKMMSYLDLFALPFVLKLTLLVWISLRSPRAWSITLSPSTFLTLWRQEHYWNVELKDAGESFGENPSLRFRPEGSMFAWSSVAVLHRLFLRPL